MSEKPPSKFSALLRTRKEEPTPEPVPEPQASGRAGQGQAKTTTLEAREESPKRQRGRPKANGKRLNPDYTQITAYIPAGLHKETKINLIRSGKREFSILIEELLINWNKKLGTSQQST